jgi:hypothetical protein
MREPVRASEIDRAFTQIIILESALARLRHGDSKSVVRLDGTAETKPAERMLQLLP